MLVDQDLYGEIYVVFFEQLSKFVLILVKWGKY